MPYVTLPVTVTSAAFTVNNPSNTGSGAPAVAVQIRNASPWLIEVILSGQLKAIDAYQAITYTVTGGENLAVSPIVQEFLTSPPGYLYTEWLLNGETSSLPDGNIQSQQVLNVSGSHVIFNGVMTGIGPGSTAVCPLLPTDRSVTVIVSNLTGAISGFNPVQITGQQSGIAYQKFVEEILINSEWMIVTVPAWGLIDQNVIVQVGTSGTAQVWVIAQPDESSVEGTFTQPSIVSPFDPGISDTVFALAIPNTSPLTIVPAAGSGQIFQIDPVICIDHCTTNASFGVVFTSGGSIFWEQTVNSGANGNFQMDVPAIKTVNGITVTLSAINGTPNIRGIYHVMNTATH